MTKKHSEQFGTKINSILKKFKFVIYCFKLKANSNNIIGSTCLARHNCSLLTKKTMARSHGLVVKGEVVGLNPRAGLLNEMYIVLQNRKEIKVAKWAHQHKIFGKRTL